MGIDRTEAARRGHTGKTKHSTKHPYAAIEHRVIDSPAYADLSYSARALLQLFARQLTRTNNGQLQASFKWCARFGFRSEHTLREALADLLAHGFIYRTRSWGANKSWARYAVTWLAIRDRDGLYLDAFRSCAWQEWTPEAKKAHGRNCRINPAETAVSPPKNRQKLPESGRQKLPCMN